MPFTLARASTTTLRLSATPSFAAISRAAKSDGPPATEGTSRRTGFGGNSCAQAHAATNATAAGNIWSKRFGTTRTHAMKSTQAGQQLGNAACKNFDGDRSEQQTHDADRDVDPGFA